MSLFTNYSIHVDTLITWFPVNANARVNAPRTRMDTFRYTADDPPFATGGKAGRFHGQALGGIDDGLTPTNLVRAVTQTGVDADQVFFMELEVGIGRSVRTQRLQFPSATTTPFLFNLRAAQNDDEEVLDTAVAFQGVVTAGRRRSELVYSVIRQFLSLFPRTGP